jgi:aryl-alcohol dehydrogenase-like predicted oxidoreductase
MSELINPFEWPIDPGLRIGLGCMRLSTDSDRDDGRAQATIAAAVDAGVTIYDTARAYAPTPDELGHNERLLAHALRTAGGASTARIVTKGGMARPGGQWVPDGRAKAILGDCEASLAALDGVPIDLYLLHAPDPRTPWRTSVRALGRLREEGLVRRVGLSNVNLRRLDEARELAEIAAVQVAVSVFDDSAVRGGLVERCATAGIALIAHSPLGGPRRARSLARDATLAEIAARRDATSAEVALAWVLGLSPSIVAIPGARRPEAVISAARAVGIRLDDADRAAVAAARGRRVLPGRRASGPLTGAEVVLIMGIPGAGKSRAVHRYAEEGYVRLNRDERGGSLRQIADALDERLAAGASRLVLDNTYLTRASRSHVIDAAARHGAAARCVWLDTPLAQAQVNLVERLLERFGTLPTPQELKERARHEEGLLMPTQQMRALRELEPPSTDEGFAAVERVPFTRAARSEQAGGAVFVAAGALETPGGEIALLALAPEAPHLVFDWRPDGAPDVLGPLVERLAGLVSGPVQATLCPHRGGPPPCWCRPPLPGLPLAFARAHDIDPARCAVVGVSPAHRTLANTLGSRYVAL